MKPELVFDVIFFGGNAIFWTWFVYIWITRHSRWRNVRITWWPQK